jgi:exopolysaccharide production protein ExoY
MTDANEVKELPSPRLARLNQPEKGRVVSLSPLASVPRVSTASSGRVISLGDASLMPPRSIYGRFFGRAGDICGGIILAVAFLPLIIPIALLLQMSGQSVIYAQKRVGRGGVVFGCFKFRTMVPDADRVLRDLLATNASAREEWQRDHKLKDDPRVTSLGRFLRRTSLDELPQILNVLKGDMSLVGPRPIVREELLRYGRWVSSYLAAKPGITGLWQVSGRNNMSYRRRVAIDIYYSRNRSVLLNLYILLKTVRVVVGGHGAY